MTFPFNLNYQHQFQAYLQTNLTQAYFQTNFSPFGFRNYPNFPQNQFFQHNLFQTHPQFQRQQNSFFQRKQSQDILASNKSFSPFSKFSQIMVNTLSPNSTESSFTGQQKFTYSQLINQTLVLPSQGVNQNEILVKKENDQIGFKQFELKTQTNLIKNSMLQSIREYYASFTQKSQKKTKYFKTTDDLIKIKLGKNKKTKRIRKTLKKSKMTKNNQQKTKNSNISSSSFKQKNTSSFVATPISNQILAQSMEFVNKIDKFD